MQESHNIRNRTFSFGAHGYNQDEVDRYLRELADRADAADVDWQAQLDRLDAQSFAVVSLGYWRPDVDAYIAELRAWMQDRAGAADVDGTALEAVAEEQAEAEEHEATAEPATVEAGWAQGIVERLRRVTEASTAPTAIAEVASEPVPEVVSAVALPLEDGVEEAAEERPAATEADRMRLFRMAVALGIEDAVSMTVDELVAAIDRVQSGGEPEAVEAPEPVEDASVVLARTKATLASFERVLADQVSQVTAAARVEQETAARRAEAILADAERRAGEIVAAAEREGDLLEEQAQRYSERVRRMADRDALQRAAEQAEPEMAEEPEAEMVEEPAAEPQAAAEPPAARQPVSRWDRVRRALGA
jgi:DivIVA domain-containing protein